MKTRKQTKQGISLIVLVITIIVMIILAAAIILSLTSSGIIDRANEAVDKTDEAQVKAYAQTLWADAFLEGKRGSELIETVENELEKLGVTPMNYTLDISDSGMDIQKFDAANWEFAYTYDQETSIWSDKILATSNPTLEGDIVAKFYNLGKEITPPDFEFLGQMMEFNSGNAYKMVIQGTGEMGALMTSEYSNITGAFGWQIETAMFARGFVDTCIIPYVTEVVICDGITNIGECAFSGAASLQKISIANSVLSIDKMAFSYGQKLNALVIPNSVVTIAERAFEYADGLKSITIPSSVTSIVDCVFYECSSLASITIPNSVTSIGANTFSDCSSLASVTIGDSVTSIGGNAFKACSSLTKITIPSSVTSIGYGAFEGCSSLTNIMIPSSVTNIGEDAFFECTNLVNVILGTGITNINSGVFCACISLITVTIPKSVTNIESGAFGYCNKLKTVNYTGSAEEWANISIYSGIMGVPEWGFADNTPLINATKVYNYTPSN